MIKITKDTLNKKRPPCDPIEEEQVVPCCEDKECLEIKDEEYEKEP